MLYANLFVCRSLLGSLVRRLKKMTCSPGKRVDRALQALSEQVSDSFFNARCEAWLHDRIQEERSESQLSRAPQRPSYQPQSAETVRTFEKAGKFCFPTPLNLPPHYPPLPPSDRQQSRVALRRVRGRPKTTSHLVDGVSIRPSERQFLGR